MKKILRKLTITFFIIAVIFSLSAIFSVTGIKTPFAVKADALRTLTPNNSYTVNVTESATYEDFTFTPSTSGKYIIYSTGSYDNDAYVILYNSSGNEISHDDDGGGDHRFSLQADLTAGNTYKYRVRLYGNHYPGTVPFTFSGVYTVSYNANGGSGAPSSQTYIYGKSFSISSSTPTKSGSTFLGWATNSSGTGTLIQPSASYNPTSDVTLYAAWSGSNTIPTISANSTYTANITYGGNYAYYYFTPSTSGKYVIYSTSSYDDKVYLYDSSGNQLDYNDDSNGTSQFTLAYNLTAGRTYKYGIKFYDSSRTGTIPFTLGQVYTITYNANGGSGAPSSQEKYYNRNITLSSTVPTRSGYTFLGWSTNSSATSASYSASSTFSANGNTTLYAVWGIQTRSLSVNSTYTTTINNGGDYEMFSFTPSSTGKYVIYSTGSADSYVYLYDNNGNQLSYDNDSGGNYQFLLKYTLNAGSTYKYKVKMNGSTRTGSIPFTFGRVYTITYNANGGSGAPSSQEKYYNRNITLSSTVPTKSGYTFLGWSTSSSATSASYSPSSTFSGNSDTTLYAVWQQNIPTLSANSTYTANITSGGSYAYYNFTPSTSGKYVIYSTGTTDTYVQLYSSSGSELSYNDDGGNGNQFRLEYNLTAGTTYKYGVRFYSSSSTGSIPFTFGQIYTITYNANGGSGAPSSQEKDYGVSISLSSTIPTKSGYTFLGWSTSSSATSASYSASSTFSANANTTLYAVWGISTRSLSVNSTYTTTINNGGDYEMFSFTPSSTGKYVIYSTSSYDDKVYLYDATGNILTSNDDSNGSSQFTLVYTLNAGSTYCYKVCMYSDSRTGSIPFTFGQVYTVSYNANGGSGAPSSQEKYYNRNLTLSSTTPTKSGYTFSGWSTSSSATSASYNAGSTYSNNSSVTLYAVWSHTHTYTNSCDTTCNICGYTRSITHSYSSSWSTNSSSHWHTCSVCGATKDSASHSYSNSCDATCNTCGYTRSVTHSYSSSWSTNSSSHWHTCSVCGATKDSASHSYSNSCDATCNTCGYTRSITHSYTSSVVNATCTTNGTKTYRCTVCSHSYTESIPALGHNYSSTYTTDVAATCAREGSKSKHCTRCDAKTSVTSIPKDTSTHVYEKKAIDSHHSKQNIYASVCSVCGNKNGFYSGSPTALKKGDIIELGSYPQTRVTDSSLISTLNSKSGTWVSYKYYINNSQSDFMKYKDITYNGIKYRAVTFSSYRPWKKSYSSSSDYSYQYNNGYSPNTTYWFKFEPLKWKVLDPDTGLAIAVNTIDAQAFDNDGSTSNYFDSSLRTWLNDTFYNTAFSSADKLRISTRAFDSTHKDNVYLISYDEIINRNYGFDSDSSRVSPGTDYAKSQGLQISNGSGFCWTRTAYSSLYTYDINSSGSVDDSTSLYFNGDGIRPALSLTTGSIPSGTNHDATVNYTSAIKTPSTCTQKGKKVYTCTKCSLTYTETLPVDSSNHDFTSKTTTPEYLKSAATCKTPAVYYYKCTRCTEKSGTYTVGTAPGHNYSVTWVWKTDRSSATATFSCSVCGKTWKTSAYKDKGAITSATTKKATCTASGQITYTATVTYDGRKYTSTKTNTIAKLGHSYGTAQWTWKAGVDSATAKYGKPCKRCDYVYGKTATVTASVTKKATTSASGTVKYTAKVTDGTTKTSTKSVTIPKISSVKLSYNATTYNGSKKSPTLTVKDSNGNTISKSYYTVSGLTHTAPGTYRVTVTFKNRYSGTKTLTYTIKKHPAKADGNKATWSSLPNASKYEVYVDGTKKITTTKTSYEIKECGSHKVYVIAVFKDGTKSKKSYTTEVTVNTGASEDLIHKWTSDSDECSRCGLKDEVLYYTSFHIDPDTYRVGEEYHSKLIANVHGKFHDWERVTTKKPSTFNTSTPGKKPLKYNSGNGKTLTCYYYVYE